MAKKIKGEKSGFGRTVLDLLLMPLLAVVGLFTFLLFVILEILAFRRWPGPGFRCIYVNRDGSARELTPKERAYLNKDFRPGDGARPDIKFFYWGRFFGRRAGFLHRRHLPWWVKVGPSSMRKKRRG